MAKDYRKYLLYILECVARIEEDVRGGAAAFDASHMIQDAVIRNLQVMAESTQRLSAELKAARIPRSNGPELRASETFWFTTISGSTCAQCGRS